MRQQAAVLVVLAVLLGLGLWWWSRDLAPAPGPVDAPAAKGSLQMELGDTPKVIPTVQRTEVPSQSLADAAAVELPAAPSPEELWGRVVVAGSGAPIEGAEVTLRHRDADEFWNLDLEYGKRIEDVGTMRSAADGTFKFAVPRAKQHQLFVQAAGFAPVTRTDLSGGSEVLVEMKIGAAIEGVVRSGGQGLVDIPVTINVRGESIELAQGRTAAGGAFSFTGLTPNDVFVQVKSPKHSQEWKSLALEAGKIHRVEIDLDPGKTLRGRVVEATTGTPIVDAEVADSWTFQRVARTGMEGKFELPGVEDQGFVSVHVRAAGYASAFANLAGRLDQEAVFALVRGGEVVGRLLDDRGAPVRSAYVAIAANVEEGPGMMGCDWIRAEVGGDGRFIALGLRPVLHYWLYARANGKGTRVYKLARQLTSGDRLDVGDIVLRAAGGLEGRVVDDAGEPIAGVEVSLRGSNHDQLLWSGEDRGRFGVSQFESRDTKSSAAGVFRFTGLSAGEYAVSVRPQGRSEAIESKVLAKDGEIVEVEDLVVNRGLSIAGVLVFADGREPGDAAAGMHLSTVPEKGGQSSSARVLADGQFVFRGLAPGAYTVSMFGAPKGWSLAPRLQVVAGTTDLRLVLEASVFVSGKVVDAQGQGVKARVYVRYEGARGGSALHATEDDGAFRVEVAASFRGSVGAHATDDPQVQARVENVSAGQEGLVLKLASRQR